MASNFSVYDYLVLGLVFLISITIGIVQSCPTGFFKRKLNVLKSRLKKKNTKQIEQEENELKEIHEDKEDVKKMNDYITTNKSMHLLPVACSILASMFSTNTIIGMPAEVYQYGMLISVRVIPELFAAIVSAYVFLPIIGKLNLVTMNEYFQLRFNSKIVRIISLVSYPLSLILWTSMVIYGTGTSLSSVTGISIYWTMTILGVVTTTYTAFGGMRGVIWSDVFQLFVMISALLFIIIKGTYDVGGVEKVWKIASDGGRINFFDLRASPFIRQTFWSIVFGDMIASTVSYNTEQSVIQRFSASKSVKNAQYAMLITGFGSVFILFSSGFVGLIIYATYFDCDPLSIPTVSNVKGPNQLLAYYTTDKLHYIPGISGFILGAVVSASISTISTSLNGLAVIFWNDCFKQISYFQKFTENKSVRFIKLLVVLCGTVCLAFSYLFALIGGNLVQFGYLISGCVTPPISLLFLMGSCFYFVNTAGAIAGSLSSLVVGLWILIGQTVVEPEYPILPLECSKFNISLTDVPSTGEAINVSGFDKFYSISFHLFYVIVISVGLVIGLAVSIATGGLKNNIPDNLVLINKKSNKVSNMAS